MAPSHSHKQKHIVALMSVLGALLAGGCWGLPAGRTTGVSDEMLAVVTTTLVIVQESTPDPQIVILDNEPDLAADDNEPTATTTATATSTATPTPTRTPTKTAIPRTATPTAAASLTPSIAATSPPPTATPLSIPGAIDGNWQLAEVVYVVDGDTIEVRLGGQNYRVRYIGMDTPERDQPYFDEATEANRRLVNGQTVILVKDVSETDRYGRLLRYVFLQDGTFVNAELVRLGYASVATFPPDVRHQDLFLRLQQEAREAQRGLWGIVAPTNTPLPQPTNTVRPTAVPTSAPQPTSPPTGAIVLISLTSPASPGQNATLVIRVDPGAVCDPGVIYRSGESGAQGLDAKTAGANGQLSWTWRVGTNTAPGTWTVYVVCNPGGRREWPFVVQ